MKLSNILKMCLNYKVILGVIAIIALIYFVAPRYASFSWILLALICPLSMVLMMSTMQHSKDNTSEQNKDNSDKIERM